MTDVRPETAGVDPEGATPPAPPTEIAERVDNVARNSLVMAIGTFGSRVLGFVRAALLIAAIGIGVAADSFNIANTLPTQLFVLINGGLISALLIPQLTKAMLRQDGGQDFSDRLITMCLLVLGVTTVASIALTPWIIGALTKDNAGQQFVDLTTFMAYICMPQLFFYGLYAVLGQVLQARGNFLAFAWAPAWANLIHIAGLSYFVLTWGKQPDVDPWTTEMILVLGITTTLGIVVQGLSLAWPLWKSGFRYRPRFGWRGYGFGDMSRMTGWTVAALVISQFYGFVTTKVISPANADVVGVAGNAVQANAYALYILPHSIITTSIVTALFPAMSRAHERGDLAELRRRVVSGLKGPAVLLLPAAAGFIALGRPIAKSLFWPIRYVPSKGIDEPGSIALVLAIMSLGLLPFGITALKQRYCFARGDGWLNFWLVALMTAINLIGCAVAYWYTPAKYVVAMVAAWATLANIVSAGAFLVVARRELDGLAMGEVSRLWVRLTIASGLAGLAAWGASNLVFDPSDPWFRHVLALTVGGLVFVAVFLVMAALMRIREVEQTLAPIRRRLPFPAPGKHRA